MKPKNISLFYSCLFVGFISCSVPEAEKPAEVTSTDSSVVAQAKPTDSLSQVKPTETFRGNNGEQEIVFSHSNYQTYTLSAAGQITSGHLNTERGYGDDRNATVYVLNDDKPKAEQKYFVRTPRGSVYMLDQDRYVVDDAYFEAVPTAKEKPVVKEKKAEKPVVAEKQVPKAEKVIKSNKKKRTKKRRRSSKMNKKVAASQSVKEKAAGPEKKLSKSPKKKKAVRKSKKKTHKKRVHRKKKKAAQTKSDSPQ